VDPVARTVRVGAGAITAAVHEHCAPHGLTWPIDCASSGSSQVGGNISTNAGGVRVVRYGLTRQWVLGLEVVLPNGEVVQLNGALEKNNTGVDLRQLFIGSEGTLGVITHATLKLCPLPRATQVALLAVQDLPTVLEVFGRARAEDPLELQAFEYFSDACLGVVLEESGGSAPFPQRYPAYLLVELEAGPGANLAEASEGWLGQLFEDELVVDGVLSASTADAARLWSFRERISESLSKKGFVHKNDVALPVSRLAQFTVDLEATLAERYPDFGVYLFGHVGDGNLHVNIMKPDGMAQESFLARVHETDAVLFEMIREHAGSVSAEHGVGLLKKAALPFSRSAAELALLRSVKKAVDPHGILNPGKIFDL
ncbi:MAG: FAD-binding oxidoreductase, partial [Myxococcota bacterium]